MADTLVVVYTSIYAHNGCRDENCLAGVGLDWQSINVILYLKYLMMEQKINSVELTRQAAPLRPIISSNFATAQQMKWQVATPESHLVGVSGQLRANLNALACNSDES